MSGAHRHRRRRGWGPASIVPVQTIASQGQQLVTGRGIFYGYCFIETLAQATRFQFYDGFDAGGLLIYEFSANASQNLVASGAQIRVEFLRGLWYRPLSGTGAFRGAVYVRLLDVA